MKALVLGLGRSGLATIKLLEKNGFEVYKFDDNIKEFKFGLKDRLPCDLSFIVLSPAVSLDNRLVKLAKKLKIEVVGELELSSRICPCDILAVTGTNGKTTTTTLLGELMKSEFKTWVGGNIGIPLAEFVSDVNFSDKVVLEVSSFQLETIKNFRPHVACLLNLSSDHINRHKSMKKYIEAKLKIFQNMNENDFAVLNADDGLVCKSLKNFRGNTYYFSTKNEVVGCFSKDGFIYFKDNKNITTKICSVSSVKIVGEHNLSNALCAICMFILAGGKIDKIKKVLEKFKGVDHRLQFVDSICRVDFYNDSKATNPNSTIVAMNSFSEPTVLILGGSDKGFGFDEVFSNMPNNIKAILVMGEVKDKILKSAKKYKFTNIYIVQSLKEAVSMGYELLKTSGGVVLLSPATASFDMFSNYAQRGKFFVCAVKEKKLNETKQRKTKSKNQKKT